MTNRDDVWALADGVRLIAITIVSVLAWATAITLATADEVPPRPVCHVSGNILVVSRDRVGDVGQNIIVRTRSPSAACADAPRPGDFVVKDTNATFLALEGRMLALEASTGPDGRLLIYDVIRRRKLVDVDYDDSRQLRHDAEALVYWRVGSNAMARSSCPDAWQAANKGIPGQKAHRTFEVRLRLAADGPPRETGMIGCRLMQYDIE